MLRPISRLHPKELEKTNCLRSPTGYRLISHIQRLRQASLIGKRPAFNQQCSTSTAQNLTKTSDEQKNVMRRFTELLLRQNKVMNLTAINTFDEAWQRHVEDSLALLPTLDACLGRNLDPKKLIDVGSGAGLPGVIIAIARPGWQICLLDSLQKRCNFVELAASSLSIQNVSVKWARAETAGQASEFREEFDCAFARAVAETRVLAELCLPFVKVDGHFVAAKGPKPDVEVQESMKAIELLGGRFERTELVQSFGPEGQRTAVVVRKICRTPDIYPRKEGRPQKRPL